VSAALPIPVIQFLQVATIGVAAPGISGVIAKVEARLQGRRGPRVLQPYYDLAKLLRKEALAPEGASWVFLAAPVGAAACYLTVPLLIPVLTSFGLPLGYMGDILGGGLILTLGSFMITLAGLDTRSAYGGIGSSRAVMVTILAEPTLILVFVGITLLAKAMLPFVVNHLLVAEPSIYWGPTHLFLVAAFFVLILVETDRLPIHSSTHIEVYMIDEARILEYSGPMLAILRWASMMKQFILYTIFCNVLLFPWALSRRGEALGVVGSIGAVALKFLAVACVVVFVETVQSRLRFYRYQEPLAASFMLAILAIVGTQLS
jgi:formate hydrogenlyase subunit 4